VTFRNKCRRGNNFHQIVQWTKEDKMTANIQSLQATAPRSSVYRFAFSKIPPPRSSPNPRNACRKFHRNVRGLHGSIPHRAAIPILHRPALLPTP
jgi:hypothetical protein